MLKKMIPFLCGMSLLVAACTPTPPVATTGTISVTVNVPATGTVSPINITFSGGPAGTTVDAITTAGGPTTRTVPEGVYQVSVGAATGFTSTTDPANGSLTVTAGGTANLVVTYTAQQATGAVNPSKTFTNSFGVGSLAFIPGSGAGAGRLYGTGNANAATDASGRLYLEPGDLTGASGAVPAGQVISQQGLLKLAFNTSGANMYELQRSTTNFAPTFVTRYPRATIGNNLFTPLDFIITSGRFQFGTPTIEDYNLFAPTDILVDGSGNLWVIDPTSNARLNIDGLTPAPAAGRLVCYSAADQTTAAGTPSPNNRIGTPGVIYYGSAVAGARTLALDASGNLWIAGGTGANARLVKIQVSALRTGQSPAGACPNLNTGTGNPDNEPLNTGSTGVTVLTGAALVGPVDLAISGSNLLVGQSNASTNNILTVALSATSIPTTTPTTINGIAGNITSLAVDSGGKTWVGTAGAAAPNAGRIYQLP